MSVRVTRTFGPLREILPESADLMREIGDFATRRIRTRTERQIDVRGQLFQPLSPAYAQRKRTELGHSRADLTVSGRMLNDMGVVAVTETSVEISFRSQGGRAQGRTLIQRSRAVGAADKAFFHTFGNRGVIRDFFGLSEEDEELIAQRVEEEIARRIDAS